MRTKVSRWHARAAWTREVTHHGGVLATKVGYFGVKSAKVPQGQMGTKPAKVGHLAPGVLKVRRGPQPRTDGRLRKKVFALRCEQSC